MNITIVIIVFTVIIALLVLILIRNHRDMKDYLKMMNAESDLTKLDTLKEEE